MKGIWFDNTHSYNDLKMVVAPFEIPPATPKTSYFDIPGADGSADMTEALGEVKFNDRECSFTFTVFPYENYEEKKTHVSNTLNGRKVKIRLDKDPNYFWDARCTVNSYASDRNLRKIVVNAKLAPYKLKTTITEVVINSGTEVVGTLLNARKTVVPTITTLAAATIVFEGNTYTLNAGTHTILNIELKHGSNTVKVTSTKAVTFKYQEGDL